MGVASLSAGSNKTNAHGLLKAVPLEPFHATFLSISLLYQHAILFLGVGLFKLTCCGKLLK